MNLIPRPVLLPTLGLLFATGCTVGPNYQRPATVTPAAWKETPSAETSAVLPPEWWRIFHDGALNALEAQAVAGNQDLQRAAARLSESRALFRASRAALYPQVSGGAAYTRSRHSESTAEVRPQASTDDYSASFELGYELDLWGRLRRTTEAVQAEAGAIAANRQAVLLTLTAEVARHYHLLRSLDEERTVLAASVALRQDAVRLQTTRYEAGLINEMDVTRARTELANVEAELHAVARSRAQLEHALAVLCGQPPAGFAVAAQTAALIVAAVPAGLPSGLLQRRPDIVEAELSLQAASARIGVAKAAFFPVISLTGAAGFASADLGTLLESPSRFAQFGPGLSVPVFQGGRNRANLQASEARYEQSVANYRGKILQAFREVEDALSDLASLGGQSEAVGRALASARDTAKLADQRYQRGLSSYLDVVDAQRAALQAERQDTQLRSQRIVATILLVKALGGGWQPDAGAVHL